MLQNFLPGSTLLDLQQIYECTYYQVSSINTVWGVTYTLGALSRFIFHLLNILNRSPIKIQTCLKINLYFISRATSQLYE